MTNQGTTTNPDYAWYRDALAGKAGQIHIEEPQCGFFSRSRRGETALPASIWRAGDGQLVASVGFPNGEKFFYGNDIAELWPYIAGRAIPEDRYWSAIDNGRWPDDLPDGVVTAKASAERSNMGDVAPEVLKGEEIDNALAGLDGALRIEDDTMLAAAQSLRSRLLELSRGAETARKAEKQPFLDGGEAVDRKWTPMVRKATAGANQLRAAMEDYEDAKRLAARRAAEQAAREAREAAEKAAAERAAQTPAEKADTPPETTAPPTTPPPPARPTTVRGAYGRAASTRIVKTAAAITDLDALFAYFRTDDRLLSYLLDLADRAVKIGTEVPGVKIDEKTSLR